MAKKLINKDYSNFKKEFHLMYELYDTDKG